MGAFEDFLRRFRERQRENEAQDRRATVLSTRRRDELVESDPPAWNLSRDDAVTESS
jgi:hypothetical protein